MKELLDLALSTVNLPLTALFGLLILYWLLTLLTGLDLDFFDVDIDTDIDSDIDFDTQGNIDSPEVANTEVKKDQTLRRRGKLNFFQAFLRFFNFVGLPFMFTFTFFVLFWWAITMAGTSITQSHQSDFGFLFFFGAIIPALILTKIITTPFKLFFININNKGEATLELLGREGTLQTALSGNKIATLEIKVLSNPIKILVQSKNGTLIPKNTPVQIINQIENKQLYIIRAL